MLTCLSFPGAAERYSSFREKVFAASACRVAEPEYSRPSTYELDIQAQWFGGEFGRNFTGTNGERIEIVQFGHWNRAAGPDFTECAVRINGELRAGPIELDIRASDWEGHGHGANPNFDPVVLHIYTDGPALNRFFTRTSSHHEVCQLQLPQFTGLQGPPDYLPEAYPGRCVTPLGRMSNTEVESILHSAAQFRLLQKSMRFRSMAESTTLDQAMFQGIAEALGFRQNKTQMAVLAQRNPIRTLLELNPMQREARLFGAAGFMEQEHYEESLSEDSRQYLGSLWEEWWKIRDEVEPSSHRAIPWNFGGSRPVNHPQRRVGALAVIANHWRLLSSFWRNPQGDCEKALREFFDGVSHSYWENHYTLRSAPSDCALKLVGADRQRDILGNLIFPCLVAKDESFWEDYEVMCGSVSNEKLRRALLRLFGSDDERAGEFSKLYFQQQGLLQIYRDFCLEDHSECENCPFPEQLLQWRTSG